MPLTNEDRDRALAWHEKHRAHVDAMLGRYERRFNNPTYPPSGSDCLHPELWKPGHWKWFFEGERSASDG